MMVNNSITNAAGPSGEGSFCERYLDVAGDLAGIGKWFLVVALLLGVAAVVIKAILDFRKPAPDAQINKNDTGGVAATLVTALKGLIESLSAAPTWLAIFGAGLAILWAAGGLIPKACEPYADDKPAQAAAASDGDPAEGNVAVGSNVSVAGGNATVPASNVAVPAADGNAAR